MNLKYLPIGDDAPHVVNAVVEIPKGSRNKYEYNMDLGVFQLDRVLYSSMHYPEAYGFIPSTLYDDGDPVDVLIVIDQPLQTGIMIEVRPIGILKMQDEKGTDDKIISVAKYDPTYAPVREVKELPKHLLIEIEHYCLCEIVMPQWTAQNVTPALSIGSRRSPDPQHRGGMC